MTEWNPPNDADDGDAEGPPEIQNPFPERSGPVRADSGEVDSSSTADAPLATLAAEMRERHREGPADDPFDQMDVSELDGEAVWESLDDDELEAGPGGATEHVGETEASPEHVVKKREYCQRCEYLSEPPEVSCGHDGTDIVEAVDSERFRVRDCPMVSEDGTPGPEEA